MICEYNLTKLNASKYCYVSLKLQLNMSFVYTQLNEKTVLFQAIQFSISRLFSHCLNVKKFYLTHREDHANIPDQSKPESNGNEGILRIP